ncbi:MAG: MBL fold metallo-hydrolase [Deltaproteobacteria bacterium]|jgi:hydroxyacylglutathione hydrolase|nr:MBL fold metallo-hydrolase [Deltaproteobacteria bacterium]
MPKPTIKQIPIGPMMNYTYLIADEQAGVCAVVDPCWDAETIFLEADKVGLKIEKILLTHTHFDHANALEPLFNKTHASVFVNVAEAAEIPSGIEKVETGDGYKIELAGLNIECLHTPGHTPGSQCFLVNDSIFTGDTLFVDGCGRVDLPGGNPGEMLTSLKRLASLDDGITVYPGHNYGSSERSTIGDQKKKNPYMNANSEGALL